ncbi:hypothetical protein ACWGNQ_33535, partial [[Kitasatospora] papulosa]
PHACTAVVRSVGLPDDRCRPGPEFSNGALVATLSTDDTETYEPAVTDGPEGERLPGNFPDHHLMP